MEATASKQESLGFTMQRGALCGVVPHAASRAAWQSVCAAAELQECSRVELLL